MSLDNRVDWRVTRLSLSVFGDASQHDRGGGIRFTIRKELLFFLAVRLERHLLGAAFVSYLEAQKAEIRANFAVFQAALPTLLPQFEGKYAVLKNARVIDIFDSFAKALDYCGATYDDRLFSIQEITVDSLEAGRSLYATNPVLCSNGHQNGTATASPVSHLPVRRCAVSVIRQFRSILDGRFRVRVGWLVCLKISYCLGLAAYLALGPQ